MNSIRPEDLTLAVWAISYLTFVILLLYGAGRVGSIRWYEILYLREWMIAFKLLCIVALLLLLVLLNNARDLPQEVFIYGRF